MSDLKREVEYQFGQLCLVCRQFYGRQYHIWYLICPECGKRRRINRLGKKYWVANCENCKIEATLTPSEYYVKRHQDLSKILVDI